MILVDLLVVLLAQSQDLVVTNFTVILLDTIVAAHYVEQIEIFWILTETIHFRPSIIPEMNYGDQIELITLLKVD